MCGPLRKRTLELGVSMCEVWYGGIPSLEVVTCQEGARPAARARTAGRQSHCHTVVIAGRCRCRALGTEVRREGEEGKGRR